MADTTLGADCALSKRDDETSQQFAGLDTLEAGSTQLEYVQGLTHAIMDVMEDLHDLINVNGAKRDDDLAHFTSRAITLLCLQLERGNEAASKITAAARAWPVASAQA